MLRDGKIAALGANVDVPAGAEVIDVTGRFISPGIIDAHSHMANDAINEGGTTVSSMTGIVTNPPNTYYSATKHALEALTEGLAKEVGPLGIAVCAIEPGAFQTDYLTRSMHQAGDLDAYAHVAERKELMRAFAEHLPGDPAKLAAAVLQLADMDDPPLRLLLGSDVLGAFREKTAAWTKSVDEWEAVTTSVNFD